MEKLITFCNHDMLNSKLVLVSFVVVLIAPLFDITFSKPPPRNSMFIQLLYNEDKIIAFLDIYICFNLHVY